LKEAARHDPSSQTPILRAEQESCMPILPNDRPTLPRYLFIADTATAGPRVTAKGEAARREKIEQAAATLDGRVERLAFPFGDGMIYTICELPSNTAAASFATIMRSAYATGIRTVALPKPRQLYYSG
jgi:hypothetical protein